jgi:hypothetical protein
VPQVPSQAPAPNPPPTAQPPNGAATPPGPAPTNTTPPTTIALAPPTVSPPQPAPVTVPVPPAEPTEDQQMIALLADLQRYNSLSADDVRREIGSATTALTRQRNDANRVRLAVLYTLSRTPQDDQRALLLFENVAKGNPGPTPIKLLAAVLEVQVAERQRAVREEQARANDANRKLEALREMERALLRDRVRSGGGGGGGGSAGGSGH